MFMIDMQGPRLRDRIEQAANAGRAVLRLLHRKPDQVVVARIDLVRPCRDTLPGNLRKSI